MAGKGISADIPRLKTFMRDLKKIDPALAKATNRRFRDAAGKVASDASRRAPKKSGRLARSIRPKVTAREGAAVAASAPYAAVHEYGGRHRVFGRGRWVTQRPQPYLRPAVAANKNEFFRAADDAVREAAREAGFK